jgi:hypothetical protein
MRPKEGLKKLNMNQCEEIKKKTALIGDEFIGFFN